MSDHAGKLYGRVLYARTAVDVLLFSRRYEERKEKSLASIVFLSSHLNDVFETPIAAFIDVSTYLCYVCMSQQSRRLSSKKKSVRALLLFNHNEIALRTCKRPNESSPLLELNTLS